MFAGISARFEILRNRMVRGGVIISAKLQLQKGAVIRSV
jgi:hypothetical protein